MNKRILLAIPLAFLLSGCSLFNILNKKASSDKDNSGSSDISETTSGGIVGNSKTFDFKTAPFTPGYEISTHISDFLDYLNKDGDIVESFACEKCFCQANYITNSSTSVLVGTAKYAGNISFRFKYNITKISFVLQGYHKWDDYTNQWSVDEDSQLIIEGQTYKYESIDTSKPPEKINDSITLETAKKTITFQNNDLKQRMFIHSLTVEWA